MTELKVFNEHVPGDSVSALTPVDELVLSFDQRQKARQKAQLVSGAEVGIQVERGVILRGGDLLKAADGTVVKVTAADEPVSIATTSDTLLLAKAAYHLGNRHVPLQVGRGFVQYRVDHVLDHMIESLGLRVTHDNLPFEPEGGAYSNGTAPPASHSHHHHHGHSHEH